MHLEDWLDDLCVRFIINLPQDDLSSVERICFAVEEAQWYYEDFIRPLDPSLPSMSLRNFCIRIFAHCPLLSSFSQGDHMQAFEQFLQYKMRIPVRGAIMLNEAMDSAVLVKGWKKGANWSFPRGKINKDEDDLTCAIREVYEETGYDLEAAGLVPEDRNVKYIDITIRDQDLRLYVFRGVPMDTHFEPKTRKEISKIQWWRISDLPSFQKKHQQPQAEAAGNANKFYMVAPFIRSVRKWASEQKSKTSNRAASNQYLTPGVSHDDYVTEDDQGAESNTQDQVYMTQSVPSISQLETALRTALKIQPPTQGLQLEALSAMQSPVRDSGQELLALLQGKPRESSQAPTSNFVPQTPLDHILTQPPFPRTPHHQQHRPAVLPAMPPLPAFPTHVRGDVSNQPTSTHRDESFSILPPRPGFPPDLRGTFSYPESNQHHPHQPVNQITFPQGQIHGAWQATQAPKHPHSNQPQHLVHPQPLPPQVQRAVFNGGPVHSSLPPQPTLQSLAPNPSSTASQGLNAPYPITLPQIALPEQKQSPPKLSSHSLALLNAFKRPNQTSATAATPSDPLMRDPAPVRPAPPQELPAEVSSGPSVDLLSLFKAQEPEYYPTVNPNTAPGKSPVNEAHRSSLLDLFKAPPKSSLSPRPAAATALPTSTTPSAVELSAVEPLSSNAVPASSAAVLDGNAIGLREKSQPMPELHPETNLPFRAMSILARPAQANGSDARGNTRVHEARPSGTNAPANQNRGAPAKPAPEKPFQPQILKRPQPSISKPAEPPKPTPTTAPSLPVEQPSFDRRSSQTADHKQTLLSLFGKAPSPAPAPLVRNLTGESFASLNAAAQTNAPIRPRVGSLASEDPSRAGTQAALSQADKSFLLSYLDNVAKGTQL